MARRIAWLALIALIAGGVALSIQSKPPELTPDQLAELALTAATQTKRAQAAVQLADRGSVSLEALRLVSAETKEPEIQAIAVCGLAKLWDYESMDLFLELAEVGPPNVRGQAAQMVMRMTGRHRPYQSSAPRSQRRLLVQHMRKDWNEIQEAPLEDRQELIRRLRESHE